MPFMLSRGGQNVPAEVQRWQFFLLKNGFSQVGRIDGDFGAKSEVATKYYQVRYGLKVTGSLDKATLDTARSEGYSILADAYYKEKAGTNWPVKPAGTRSPSNKWRNDTFHCFEFTQSARRNRADAESIIMGGSCDGASSDWVGEYIIDIDIKQLRFAAGYPGYVRCHRLAADRFVALFEAWEKADLLHLIVHYDGCFVPRYKRHQSPGDAVQPARGSADVDQLSNHSFGSAMDMNFAQNQFPADPAPCGQYGSTRELVEPAAAVGFYWGGYFRDGNHFELAHLPPS